MYYTLAVTLLFGVFLVSWIWHGFYVLLFLSLLYLGLVYMRDDEITGYATYNWWRRLALWNALSPVRIWMANDAEFQGAKTPRRYVFVVLPNATNTPLVWAFGLHGQSWPGAERIRPCYIVPYSLFWVPGVREIMLASGAVSDRGCVSGTRGAAAGADGAEPSAPVSTLEDVVVDLVSRGRSVAYCPTGMADALHVHETHVIQVRQPAMSLFHMAVEHNIHLVPVLCDGENDRRYIFFSPAWLRRIQAFFLRLTHYPWPLVFFPDWTPSYGDDDDIESQPSRTSHIGIQFGPSIGPQDCDGDAERMQQLFYATLRGMNNNGVDKQLEFKE